jgi:hypothetical protein
MKMPTLWMALAAIFAVIFAPLPSASAMDPHERVITTQTELIRHGTHRHYHHHHHHHYHHK